MNAVIVVSQNEIQWMPFRSSYMYTLQHLAKFFAVVLFLWILQIKMHLQKYEN